MLTRKREEGTLPVVNQKREEGENSALVSPGITRRVLSLLLDES